MAVPIAVAAVVEKAVWPRPLRRARLRLRRPCGGGHGRSWSVVVEIVAEAASTADEVEAEAASRADEVVVEARSMA